MTSSSSSSSHSMTTALPLWIFLILILVGNFAAERTVALALTSPVTTTKRNSFVQYQSLSSFKIGASLQRRQGVLVVDIENVRGKSGFALSHNDLLDRLMDWTNTIAVSNPQQQKQQQGALQIILVVDHGNQPHAYYSACSSGGLAVVFAGPSQKADDVIAHDIGKIAQWTRDYHHQQHDTEEEEDTTHRNHNPVMIVTDDQGLLRRCRKSTARKRLEIVSPLSLLEELEQFAAHNKSPTTSASPKLPHVMAAAKEIAGGAEWLLANSKVQAAKTKHIPNKRRQWLHQQVTSVQRQLETTNVGRSVYQFVKMAAENQATKMNDENDHDNNHDTKEHDGLALDPCIQAAVLESWEQLQQSLRYRTFKKEKTDDRVVLSEDFRKILHDQFQDVTHELFQEYHQSINHRNVNNEASAHVNGRALLPPTKAYVCDWIWRYGSSRSLLVASKTNNLQQTSSSATAQPEAEATVPRFSTPTLRLVVISDTHGMEDQLGPLPHGDVLLHLGDFALEGPAKILSARAFDQWLSRQPHPYKIVLRGNHDPRGSLLPLSGAMYVNSPRTIHMAGFSIALVPFVSRLTKQCLPSTCDILASHVPPMNTLDTCTSGKSAGSNVLRKRLRQMGAKSGTTTTLHRNHYHQKQQQPPSNIIETTTRQRTRKSKGPRLVLCGHIHESRGWIWHDFSSSTVTRDTASLVTQDDDDHNPTLVVNVANANAGFAREIQHGPVVLELSKDVLEDGSLSDIHMTLHMDDGEQILKPTELVVGNESMRLAQSLID